MPQTTFVYGTFRWPTRGAVIPHISETFLRGGGPENAIEILIEFDGGLALRGKLYLKAFGISGWTPAQVDYVQKLPWYSIFEKTPKLVVFDMDGSGSWEILYLRNESDASGTYAAIGLRYSPTTPAWVTLQRLAKS